MNVRKKERKKERKREKERKKSDMSQKIPFIFSHKVCL